jgi:hypothetical protein
MAGAYSTDGRDEKCIQSFGQKTRKEEITRETQVYMRGSYENRARVCGLD